MSEWVDEELDYEVDSSKEGTSGEKTETPAKSTSTSTASTAETVLSNKHPPRMNLDEGNIDEKEREVDDPTRASSSGRGANPDPSNVLSECKEELQNPA
jgi:hypothetical protein